MDTIKWSGYEWRLQERWGEIHPQKPTWWYDPSQVSIDSKGYLHLKTGHNPRYFPDLDLISPIGAGLISCTGEFSYGRFEIEARLPYGKSLWPAFWMWSYKSWPPEIDILEGFSDINEDCSLEKQSLLQKLSTLFSRKPANRTYNIHQNVHYIDQEVNIPVSFSPDDKVNGLLSDTELGIYRREFKTAKNPTLNFIKYTCVWHPDSLKIFYDDVLMFSISVNTSAESLKSLSSLQNHPMNVILNNGVTSFADVKNPPESDFVIKYFKYEPLNA